MSRDGASAPSDIEGGSNTDFMYTHPSQQGYSNPRHEPPTTRSIPAPHDCLGNSFAVGTIILLAEDGILKPGVIGRIYPSNGNATVTFYRMFGTPGRVVSNRRVISREGLAEACVIVPMEAFGGIDELHRSIIEHARRLHEQAGTIRRLKKATL